MVFCIASVAYWESLGFNTSTWRKSVDGAKAIVHCEYAKILTEPEGNPSVVSYTYPSEELDTILNSPEWTTNEGVI